MYTSEAGDSVLTKKFVAAGKVIQDIICGTKLN